MTNLDNAEQAAKIAEELLNEDAGNSGTGEISSASMQNPDKPPIGSLGGYTPNSPGEESGNRTTSIIEKSSDTSQVDVLDETDKDYLSEYLEQ
jgi:hypothetical protein